MIQKNQIFRERLRWSLVIFLSATIMVVSFPKTEENGTAFAVVNSLAFHQFERMNPFSNIVYKPISKDTSDCLKYLLAH